MNRVFPSILPLLLLTGCGTKPPPDHTAGQSINTDVNSTAVAAEFPRPDNRTPRLWVDDDAAAMIQAVAGTKRLKDMVHVFRWENSKLHGWAKFDSESGTEADDQMPSFELSVPGNLKDDSAAERWSGWLVVIMRRDADAPGESYDVRIEEQFTERQDNGDSQTRAFDSRRGKLLRVAEGDTNERPSIMRTSGNQVLLLRFKDGESVPWLQLRLGDSSSEAKRNGEP